METTGTADTSDTSTRVWKDTLDGQVCDWIGANAKFTPDALATIDLFSGRRHTFAQMHERVGRIATLLRERGVGKGDRVAVLSLNSTDMLDIQFGCWRIGAIYLPLNFRLTAAELTFIVNDADPTLVFLDDTFAQVGEELKTTTSVEHWIGMDGTGANSEFEDAIASALPEFEMLDQRSDDLCMIMYSSGTTGLPKGVTFNHGMMNFNTLNCTPTFHGSVDMVGFTVMPLFHIGGLNAFNVLTLYIGATTIIMRTFDPGATLDVINDPTYGVTHFLGVPAIFNALKEHPKNAQTDFSRIRVAVAGAETVPDSLVRWWLDRGLVIQEVYGMTEVCGASCFLAPQDIPDKIGSAGKAMRHCEMRIVQDESGNAAPYGELGEIWMRGPTVTPGYWNRPDANDSSYVNGWFKSGDIGRMDPDGFFYIEDRVKDMYISGGENVYPAEIENVLYEMDEILEVAVIGVPDPKWGEVGCVVAATREGKTLSMEAIDAKCSDRLAKYKHPIYLVEIPALPRNATGKVLKFELRKSIPAQLGIEV